MAVVSYFDGRWIDWMIYDENTKPSLPYEKKIHAVLKSVETGERAAGQAVEVRNRSSPQQYRKGGHEKLAQGCSRGLGLPVPHANTGDKRVWLFHGH